MPPEDLNDDATPGDLAEAGHYPSELEAFNHGLVILAMGHSYWLEPSEAGWSLLVEPAILSHARFQLSCYDRENRGWPPREARPPRPLAKLEFQGPLLWALLTAGCFWAQAKSPADLATLGCLDAKALFEQGEVWRLATALFLHADFAHLTANLFSGVFLFATLFTEYRRLQGWLLLALGSCLANLASAGIHYGEDYRSLGASTAVFTALGLLTGKAMGNILRGGRSRRWRTLVIPLASGAGLLALFGSGGFHTDLTAHFTGFVSGLLLGLPAWQAEGVRS